MANHFGLTGIKAPLRDPGRLAAAVWGGDRTVKPCARGLLFDDLTVIPSIGELHGWTLLGDRRLAADLLQDPKGERATALAALFPGVSRYALYQYDEGGAIGWVKWERARVVRHYYLEGGRVSVDEGTPLNQELEAKARLEARPRSSRKVGPAEFAECALDVMSGAICPDNYVEGHGFLQDALIRSAFTVHEPRRGLRAATSLA